MTRPNFSVTLQGLYRTRTNSSDTGWLWSTGASGSRFCSETVSGVSRRKPKGWVPPTGYSLLRREYTVAQGTCWYQIVPTNWTKHEGAVGTLSSCNSQQHFDLCLSEATSRSRLNSDPALQAARVKLKNGKVNLGVAFGERKATARMIGDTASRIARSVRQVQTGNFRGAARTLGILSEVKKPRGSNWTNHWLQLQYGVKPLLSDVYGACDALARRPLSDWIVTAKASRRDSDTFVYDMPFKGSSYPTGNYDACRVEAVRRRGVFVRIDAVPVNDLTMSLASLGVTNPLLVAWELVPYSFVVDWFLPVGQWLESLDAMVGYGSAWTSTSYYNETLWQESGKSKTWSANAFIKNSFSGTKRVLDVQRVAQSGVPIPTLPRFKDPRSLGHMANGLSLLAQAFGRSR